MKATKERECVLNVIKYLYLKLNSNRFKLENTKSNQIETWKKYKVLFINFKR